MFTQQRNIDKIKELNINDLKAIYTATLTVDGTVKTLATQIAAIATAGKGKPKAVSISVGSTNLTSTVARFTLDGTTPVALTTGDPLLNFDYKIITEFANIQKFKVTEEAAGPTTKLFLTFYK
jgi:hypothetical protein